ncbi:MAG TPA: hypothetical protein DCP97_02230, partial [Ruminococcaceae bacterium]|nr:hypothetical protein [Oscillospiraceae bacterium]
MKKIISLLMAISLFCSLTLQAFAVQWRYDKAVVTIIDNGDASATAKQGSSGTRQIQYCINGGDWLDYIKPIEIDTEGITKIEARAIDNAGNISPIGDGEIRIDRTPPNAKIAVSTTEWTNKNVELLAAAWDEHSGVAKIINPIGESSNRYSAPANGTYTFTIIDNVGLSSYASVGISNIEKVIEPLKVDTTDEWTNKPMVIELPKQDKIALSGVSKYQYRIEGKDGQAVKLEEKPSFFENIVNSLKSLFFVTAYAADASDGWYDYIKPIVINGEGIDRVLFRAISHAGNITPVAAIEVKKDYTVPEASIWYNQKTNIVSINATDNLSGVKSITLPAVDKDGKNIVVSGSYAEFSPQKDGDYTVIIEDMATNKAEYTFPIALPVSGSDDDIVAIKPELKAIAGNPPQAIKTPGIVRVTGNFGKVIAANDTAVSDDKQPVENTIVPKTEKTIAVAEPTAKINWLAVFIIIALFFLLIIIII